MVKLNRTTEYGLMALSYIRSKTNGELASAREIAESFHLPFEILAKTLQRLKEQGLISSTYGTRGGYILSKDLSQITLLEFLTIMEGPVGVVPCASMGTNVSNLKKAESGNPSSCCDYSDSCSIKPVMGNLNDRISEFLGRISLEELTRMPIQAAAPVLAAGEEP